MFHIPENKPRLVLDLLNNKIIIPAINKAKKNIILFFGKINTAGSLIYLILIIFFVDKISKINDEQLIRE